METKNDALDEMLLALKANIEFLKNEGSSQLVVRNGTFINDVGGVFIYEFELDFLQELVPDAEIEVRVRNKNISGKVIQINGRKIQIQLEQNIGPSISEARIIVSSYYLLQLLHDKLEKAKTGELKLTDLAQKTFGYLPAKTGIDEKYGFEHLSLSGRDRPNEYQEKAIRQALGSEVLFIWGPPGTGKTATIAQIIEGFIEQGLSTLLLAHTNVATDGAFRDFIEIKEKEGAADYEQGKFIRVGDISDSELLKYEMVRLDVIEEKIGQSVKEEIRNLEHGIQEQKRILVLHQAILAEFKRLERVNNDIKKTTEELQKKSKEFKSYKEQEEILKKRVSDIEARVLNFQSLGRIGKFFSGDSLEGLTKEKAKTLLEIDENSLFIKAAQRMLNRGEEVGNQLLDEREKLEKSLEGKNEAEEQAQYEGISSALKGVEEQIKALTKELEELRASLIKDAKVISTTLTKSYSDKSVLDREYDCVILDEASMAPLPALWCAAGLAKKKVVIVGDFYQLPPVVKHKVIREKKTLEEVQKEEDLVKKWLSRDIFELTGIVNAITEGKNPETLRQLRIQYRMHPDIAEVVNSLVYSKAGENFELISGEKTKKNGEETFTVEPLANLHVGVYDTSAMNSVPIRTDSGSYYNLYSAFLSAQLAEEALENGYENVGIVTPFRPQANFIQKILIDKKIDDKVAIDTVHRFQGGQKHLIIFDIVIARPTKLTDDNDKGGDDEKIINVALSRAQDKCILIADVEALLKKHSESSLFRKYIEYCMENNALPRPTTEVLSKFTVVQESEKWLKKIYSVESLEDEMENSKLYDQKDFYKRFIADILSAKREVIIDSPYITQERLRTFLPIFQHLKDKGIQVFVITRQVDDHSDQMKMFAETGIKEMDEIGVIVLPFKGFQHRKLAIVDRNIVWEGSLNILSQRDSQEIMRRFEGENTAKQLMEFLKLERNLGAIGENALQACEFCDDIGAWYWTDMSRFGLWTHCLIGNHKIGTPPKTEAEVKKKKKELAKARKTRKKKTEDGTPICQIHELPMILRKGRWGEFWGCQKYPRCKITEKIKVKA